MITKIKYYIKRLLEIRRSEGTVNALNSTIKYFGNWVDFKSIFWDLRGGTQHITIGDITAKFDATTTHGGDTIRWTYDSEEKFIKDIIEELEDDDVFFDIGANLGIFSCFAIQAMSQGHVVAFEPSPQNVSQLQKNICYNGDKNDFSILDVALSDSEGTINFTQPADDDIGNQTGNISPTGNSIKVQSITGDKAVEDGSIPHPSVVKIDVEGAEPLVIQGLKDTLSREACRLLYCEIHLPKDKNSRPSVKDYGEFRDSILRMITNLGFDIIYTERRGSEVHVKAQK